MAQIGAAHGVRGEVRLHSFTQEPMAVADYGPLQTENGLRTLTIESVRPAKDHLVARFAGIGDRDKAETLRNVKLYVARETLPPVEDDQTFYHADLIGLAVVTVDGAPLGTVKAVLNFGAGDILEIERERGEPLMLPFTEQTVPVIDIAAKRIVANPPAETEARGED